MTRHIYLILALFLILLCISCKDHNTYYDQDWEVTTKEQAKFYRIPARKVKNKWLFRDYYITGELQFKGFSNDSVKEIWDGDIVWYYPSGRVQDKVRYKNGEIEGYFTGFEGMDLSDKGFLENELSYYGEIQNVESAVGTGAYTYHKYYQKSKQVAILRKSFIGFKDKTNYNLYFNRKGDTIGKITLDEDYKNVSGNEILFYKKNDSCVSIKAINSFKNGKLLRSIVYDKKKNTIATGSFKDSLPHQGSFYKSHCGFYKIREFEKGNILKEISYDTLDTKLGELFFKNKKMYEGIHYDCESMTTYKKGKMDGLYIDFEYGNFNKIRTRYNYKSDNRHGLYESYNEEGDIIARGNYIDNQLLGKFILYKYDARDSDNDRYFEYQISLQNKKPCITEIKKYNIDSKDVMKVFVIEPSPDDDLDLPDPELQWIEEEDYNFDGHYDFRINRQYESQITSAFYLYDNHKKQFIYHNELSGLEEISFDKETKNITSTTIYRPASHNDYIEESIGHHFEAQNRLVKNKHIVTIFDAEAEKEIQTQLYPLPVNNFALTRQDLPGVTIIQNNERYTISENTNITLKKEPFSIEFIAYPYHYKGQLYATLLNATTDKTVANRCDNQMLLKEIPFFSNGSGIASVNNNLHIDNDGHLYLFNNDDTKRLYFQKKITDEILLYEFRINTIEGFQLNESFSLPNGKTKLYLNMIIDKNVNKRIEKGELFKITLTF